MTVVLKKTHNVWEGIYLVKDLLKHCVFHKRCSSPVVVNGIEYMSGVDSLENYQCGKLGANGVERLAPLHDLTSHGSDAFRYFAEAYSAGYVSKDVNGRYDVSRDNVFDNSQETKVYKGVPNFWRRNSNAPKTHIERRFVRR
jgi:hypothetical protein